jgi:hypothetical protein
MLAHGPRRVLHGFVRAMQWPSLFLTTRSTRPPCPGDFLRSRPGRGRCRNVTSGLPGGIVTVHVGHVWRWFSLRGLAG